MTNILITGIPGIGKTTIIRKISRELKEYNPAGFYTAEIRERGIRKGFKLISLEGEKSLLSHVAIESPYQVSKYGVDISAFENFLDSVNFEDPSHKCIIIDEIGKMELIYHKFKNLLKNLLNSDKLLIATIALKGKGIIQDIKNREDVKLFKITKSNRDRLSAKKFLLNNIEA